MVWGNQTYPASKAVVVLATLATLLPMGFTPMMPGMDLRKVDRAASLLAAFSMMIALIIPCHLALNP